MINRTRIFRLFSFNLDEKVLSKLRRTI